MEHKKGRVGRKRERDQNDVKESNKKDRLERKEGTSTPPWLSLDDFVEHSTS